MATTPVPSSTAAGSKARNSVPESAFLDPANRKYPFKRYKNGRWTVSCEDLRSAIRVAGFQKRKDIIAAAQEQMKSNGC